MHMEIRCKWNVRMCKGRGGCEMKMDRCLLCAMLQGEQSKVFNLVVFGVMQLDLSFQKIVRFSSSQLGDYYI